MQRKDLSPAHKIQLAVNFFVIKQILEVSPITFHQELFTLIVPIGEHLIAFELGSLIKLEILRALSRFCLEHSFLLQNEEAITVFQQAIRHNDHALGEFKLLSPEYIQSDPVLKSCQILLQHQARQLAILLKRQEAVFNHKLEPLTLSKAYAVCTEILGPPPKDMFWLESDVLAQDSGSLSGFLVLEEETDDTIAYAQLCLTWLKYRLTSLGIRQELKTCIYGTPEQLGEWVANVFYKTDKTRELSPNFIWAYRIVTAQGVYTTCKKRVLPYKKKIIERYHHALLDRLAINLMKPINDTNSTSTQILELIKNAELSKEQRLASILAKVSFFYAQASIAWTIANSRVLENPNHTEVVKMFNYSLYGLATLAGKITRFSWYDPLMPPAGILSWLKDCAFFHDRFMAGLKSAWVDLNNEGTSLSAPLPDLERFQRFYLMPLLTWLEHTPIFELNQSYDVPLLNLHAAIQISKMQDDKTAIQRLAECLRVWIYHTTNDAQINEEACFSLFYHLPEKWRFQILQEVEKAFCPAIDEHKEKILRWLNYFPNSDGLRRQQVIEETRFREGIKANFCSFLAVDGTESIAYLLQIGLPGEAQTEYLLHPDIAKQLFDDTGRLRPKTADSRQHVIPLQVNGEIRYWAKCYPEQPSDEFAVEQLAWMVSGGHVPQSQIIKITRKVNGQAISDSAIAIHILSHLSGEPLQSTVSMGPNPEIIKRGHLESHLNDPIYCVDKRNFTEHFLRIYMVSPEDDKGTDYFVFEREGIYYLNRADNERAFYKLIELEKQYLFLTKSTLQVKSILYCFPQMNQPLDELALKIFLEIEPIMAMQRWLDRLEQEHQIYAQLFSQEDRKRHYEHKDENNIAFPSLLTVKLPEHIIQELLDRWILMIHEVEHLMLNEQLPKGLELLQALQANFAKEYCTTFSRYSGETSQAIIDRFMHMTKELYYWVLVSNRCVNQKGGQTILNPMTTPCVGPSKMSGQKAIMRSMRYAEFPTLSMIQQIASGEKDCPQTARIFFDAYKAPDLTQLLENLFSQDYNQENMAFRQFKLLSNSHKNHVLGAYIRWLKSNPKESHPSEVAQKAFLNIALCLTQITIPLDLSVFCEFLTEKEWIDTFNKVYLYQTGKVLYHLALQGLKSIKDGYSLLAAISRAFPRLKEFDLSNSSIEIMIKTITQWDIDGREEDQISHWPELEELIANENRVLKKFKLIAPKLRRLSLKNCPNLHFPIIVQSWWLNFLDISLIEPNSNLIYELTDSLRYLDTILTEGRQLPNICFLKISPFFLNNGLRIAFYKKIKELANEVTLFFETIKCRYNNNSEKIKEAQIFLKIYLSRGFKGETNIVEVLCFIMKHEAHPKKNESSIDLYFSIVKILVYLGYCEQEIKETLISMLSDQKTNFSKREIVLEVFERWPQPIDNEIREAIISFINDDRNIFIDSFDEYAKLKVKALKVLEKHKFLIDECLEVFRAIVKKNNSSDMEINCLYLQAFLVLKAYNEFHPISLEKIQGVVLNRSVHYIFKEKVCDIYIDTSSDELKLEFLTGASRLLYYPPMVILVLLNLKHINIKTINVLNSLFERKLFDNLFIHINIIRALSRANFLDGDIKRKVFEILLIYFEENTLDLEKNLSFPFKFFSDITSDDLLRIYSLKAEAAIAIWNFPEMDKSKIIEDLLKILKISLEYSLETFFRREEMFLGEVLISPDLLAKKVSSQVIKGLGKIKCSNKKVVHALLANFRKLDWKSDDDSFCEWTLNVRKKIIYSLGELDYIETHLENIIDNFVSFIKNEKYHSVKVCLIDALSKILVKSNFNLNKKKLEDIVGAILYITKNQFSNDLEKILVPKLLAGPTSFLDTCQCSFANICVDFFVTLVLRSPWDNDKKIQFLWNFLIKKNKEHFLLNAGNIKKIVSALLGLRCFDKKFISFLFFFEKPFYLLKNEMNLCNFGILTEFYFFDSGRLEAMFNLWQDQRDFKSQVHKDFPIFESLLLEYYPEPLVSCISNLTFANETQSMPSSSVILTPQEDSTQEMLNASTKDKENYFQNRIRFFKLASDTTQTNFPPFSSPIKHPQDEKIYTNTQQSLLEQYKPNDRAPLNFLSEASITREPHLNEGVWAVGILRDIQSSLREHVFLILEFIHKGVYKIRRVDFGYNPAEDINPIIKRASLEFIPLSKGEANDLIKNCVYAYHAFNISAEQGWRLIKAIKVDQQRIEQKRLGYLVTGDGSIASNIPYLSQPEGVEEVHNCYTYVRQKLKEVDTQGIESLYQHNFLDLFAAHPSIHIPDRV